MAAAIVADQHRPYERTRDSGSSRVQGFLAEVTRGSAVRLLTSAADFAQCNRREG